MHTQDEDDEQTVRAIAARFQAAVENPDTGVFTALLAQIQEGTPEWRFLVERLRLADPAKIATSVVALARAAAQVNESERRWTRLADTLQILASVNDGGRRGRARRG